MNKLLWTGTRGLEFLTRSLYQISSFNFNTYEKIQYEQIDGDDLIDRIINIIFISLIIYLYIVINC